MGVSIALEGSEGAGKSLLGRLLTMHLEQTTNFPVRFGREPGGTPLGEYIRGILKGESFKDMDPLASVFLFSAQRAELFSKVDMPFLRDNPRGVMIKDRSWLSTVALQVAEGANPEFVDFIQEPFKRIPDKFAIIDIPVEETVVRMAAEQMYASNREIDWRDKQKQEILSKIRENYLHFALENPGKCIVLDCFDDPWIKSAQIKFEIVEFFIKGEGGQMACEKERELIAEFRNEAKRIVDEDGEKKVLRLFDIEERRRVVEETRRELGYPGREELRAKMHDDWRALGLEGFSSGRERGK